MVDSWNAGELFLGVGEDADLDLLLLGTGGGGKDRLLYDPPNFDGDPLSETREFWRVFDNVLPVIWLVNDCKDILGVDSVSELFGANNLAISLGSETCGIDEVFSSFLLSIELLLYI